MMNNIKILEEYIKEVWKPKPIHNVIPDWATIEKKEIQAIENLIKENKELKEKNKEINQRIKLKLENERCADKDFISKSKVKEKITYLQSLEFEDKLVSQWVANATTINILQELLGGE